MNLLEGHLPGLQKIGWKSWVKGSEVLSIFCYCDFPKFEHNFELHLREKMDLKLQEII
jgi:hypothetical protein